MKTVCSVCEREGNTNDPDHPSYLVSHGICAKCMVCGAGKYGGEEEFDDPLTFVDKVTEAIWQDLRRGLDWQGQEKEYTEYPDRVRLFDRIYRKVKSEFDAEKARELGGEGNKG